MDYAILIIAHLIGVVMGVGGATTADAVFLRSIRDRKVSEDELNILKTVSHVVIAGLVILIGSGLLLFLRDTSLLAAPGFQIKMTIVALLTVNGTIFHIKILPLLSKYKDKGLGEKEVKSKLWLFAITGGTSAISWYSALVLGVMMRWVEWPYLFLLNAYLLLVIGGALSAFIMLYMTLFSSPAEMIGALKKKVTGLAASKLPGFNKIKKYTKKLPSRRALVLTGIAFLVAMVAFGVNKTISTETYFVCITETPPWFHSEVLEINKGDTVVWHHCDEGETGDQASGPVMLREAFAHDDHDHGDHIHTHPVMAISGPELFSSDLRVVGHLEDNNEFRHTFTKEGVYEYICPTHPYMKGIIAVGVEAPTDSLWPPDENIQPELLPPPATPGVGDIWVDTQFERVEGQEFPGTITVINTQTWETEKVISHESFNNPHNLWNSPDSRHIFQTQWHSDGFSKIDVETREVVETVSLGNAPAHLFVHPNKERVYVTLNNENRVVVVDYDLNILNEIPTSFGPHGIWIDPSGKWMSIAATLEEKLNIIDLDTEEVVAEFDAPGLPLATQITNDGRYAMASLLLEGKVRFIDLDTMEHVKDVEVGSLPIWAVHDPTGEYILVPNSGTADISVISYDTLEVVKTIPAAAGAHGITFGLKQEGGYYAYFSNKFARVVGAIDMDTLELVGHIQLGEGQWGGNGILVLPNFYDQL